MVLKRFLWLLFVAASLFTAFCSARPGLPDLSAEELKTMMEGSSGLVVVDTRTLGEYVRGRIPRSQLIPEEKFFALELLLPKEKETPLVFYCRGYG